MSSELVPIEPQSLPALFAGEGLDELLGKIEAEVRGHAVDLSTGTGRAAIAALAYKVSRSKTALDEAGKTLAAEWKAKCAAIDRHRREIRERLDALRDEVRAPLTAWEEAEKQRVAALRERIDRIRAAGVIDAELTSASLQSRLARVKEVVCAEFAEFAVEVSALKDQVTLALEAGIVAAEKREAERAELERLRAEAAAKAEAERKAAEEAAQKAREEAIRKEAAEAAAKAERERAEAEAARVAAEVAAQREAAERAEAERIAAIEARAQAEREAVEAAERERIAAVEAAAEATRQAAKAEAARLAEAARIEREAAMQRELELRQAAEKAEREKAAAIEAARKAEQDRLDREAAETARRVREREAREADAKHRALVIDEACIALAEAGVTEAAARVAIDAIVAGRIPRVTIAF